jgi:hypothetical protein
MTKLGTIIIASIIMTSCGQNSSKQKELELREREITLREKEFASKQKDSSNSQTKLAITTTVEKINKSEKGIPKALVPIVPASNVLPTWSQNEVVDGNYPLLTGLYVGALGKKPFKLVISNVDTKNKTLSGYSVTSSSQIAFEGHYTMTIREPNSKLADNIIDFKTWIFKVILFEPTGINHTGVFQLTFNATDANGSIALGSWISYDGQLYRGIKLMDPITAQDQ